jgi:hypothetical protein
MTRECIHCGLTAPVLKVGILAVLPRPRAAPTKFDQPWTTVRASAPAILNLHERIENKLFLDRTRKDSNFKRPHIYATLFQIAK